MRHMIVSRVTPVLVACLVVAAYVWSLSHK